VPASSGNLEEERAAPEGLAEDLGVPQGEDTGLGQLARRVAAEAMEGVDGAVRHFDRSPDAVPPEVQHLEVGSFEGSASTWNLASCEQILICQKPGS
jgi:hypothetical protein